MKGFIEIFRIKSLLDHSKVSTRDFKRRDLEEKFDFIIDSNDDILERIVSTVSIISLSYLTSTPL